MDHLCISPIRRIGLISIPVSPSGVYKLMLNLTNEKKIITSLSLLVGTTVVRATA